MTLERAKELLEAVVNHTCIAENSSTAIRKLMDIGFTADELVEDFSWSLTDVQDVENDILVEELAQLVDIEGNDVLTFPEKKRYVEIVMTFQDRGVKIPFGIET